MGLVVQKFGGTSVADPDRIREVANHVARTQRRGDQVLLVVSAMGKETDELLHLADQVSRTRPGREIDMLITAGERKATALVCMALHDLGVKADSFTGSQAGFITDTNHMNAKILEVRAERVRAAVDAGHVPLRPDRPRRGEQARPTPQPTSSTACPGRSPAARTSRSDTGPKNPPRSVSYRAASPSNAAVTRSLNVGSTGASHHAAARSGRGT